MKQLLTCLRNIPIFGPLIDTHIGDHSEATKELIVTLIWSTLPIWVGSIVIYALNDAPSKSYLSALFSTVKEGELLIFSTSLLAPFFYMALHDPAGSRAFPGRLGHTLPVIVIMLLCTALFSISRAKVWMDHQFVLTISFVLTFLSLMLIYLAMVYHKARLRNPGDLMREKQTKFSEDLARHRK